MRKYNEMKKEDFNVKEIPHGFIQWKGTNVCIDVFCECGHHGHFDGMFFYFFECSKCGKRYKVGANIKLIPLTENESKEVENYPSLHKDFGDI